MLFTLMNTVEIKHHPGSHLDKLLKRMAMGDKTAFADFYQETRASIYGFALSLTKNAADAEDILQETLLKVWLSADSYKAKGTPMAWVLTITKNLALMKLREKKRHQDLEPEQWDMEFHIPDSAGNTEDRHLLEAALTILTEEERQIVLLHAVSGLKFREIGELTGIGLSTVLSKYHRSLKKLKVYIEGVEADDRS
ncbi:MAG: RNA polymerase sigma factor [Lachnospiraceae bacterium]|nr:RNA polymerase sigma factor [Lachnospiraceae bacterium]